MTDSLPYHIAPDLRSIVYKATFRTPVSHHDPAQSDKSNISLFLRRKQVVERPISSVPTAEQVRTVINTFRVPQSLGSMFETLTPADFLGVAVVRKLIALYNEQGLLEGAERYRRLDERVRHNAIRHMSMYAFWGNIARDLQVTITGQDDHELLTILTMPPALAALVLKSLSTASTPAVSLARIWNDLAKIKDALTVEVTLPNQAFSSDSRMVLEVPAVSANSIRHELIREPGMWHLLNSLGARLEDLPDGVAALLYNGGDLNTSEPSNAFKLIRDIRTAYPLLSLIGGATNGFILGSSNLELSAWLICSENNDATARFGVTSSLSAFDLLDRDEMTRHTNRRIDGTPMPYGFETLVKGSEVLIEFRLRPYVTPIEVGAFWAAIRTYQDSDSTLFGQTARGFGLLDLSPVQGVPPDTTNWVAAYNAHLNQQKDQLVQGLKSGTLTTDKKVCA